MLNTTARVTPDPGNSAAGNSVAGNSAPEVPVEAEEMQTEEQF